MASRSDIQFYRDVREALVKQMVDQSGFADAESPTPGGTRHVRARGLLASRRQMLLARSMGRYSRSLAVGEPDERSLFPDHQGPQETGNVPY